MEQGRESLVLDTKPYIKDRIGGICLEQVSPLEFSEELLNKRIVGFRAVNIQGVADQTIKVPKSGIIRLNASSETGKSTFFKVYEAMVTSKYRDKRSVDSLLRSGCDRGYFVVVLLNGTQIGLYLDRTNLNNCFYGIVYPDGRQEKLNYSPLPMKVVELFGYFTTGIQKPDFCLNIRRKGLLAVVETDRRLNSDVFGLALNCEQLESTIKATATSLEEVTQEYNLLEARKQNVKFTMESIDIRDTTALEQELVVLETLLSQLENIELLDDSYTKLYGKLTQKPTLLEATDCTNLINQFEVISNLDYHLTSVLTKQRPIVFNHIDLSEDLDRLVVIEELLALLDRLVIRTAPVLEEYEEVDLTEFKMYAELEDKLIHLSSLVTNKPRNPEECKDYDTLLNQLQVVSDLQYRLENVNSANSKLGLLHLQEQVATADYLLGLLETTQLELTHLSKLHTNFVEIEAELSKYKCPTCGQYYFNDEHKHVV